MAAPATFDGAFCQGNRKGFGALGTLFWSGGLEGLRKGGSRLRYSPSKGHAQGSFVSTDGFGIVDAGNVTRPIGGATRSSRIEGIFGIWEPNHDHAMVQQRQHHAKQR